MGIRIFERSLVRVSNCTSTCPRELVMVVPMSDVKHPTRTQLRRQQEQRQTKDGPSFIAYENESGDNVTGHETSRRFGTPTGLHLTRPRLSGKNHTRTRHGLGYWGSDLPVRDRSSY